MTSPDLHSFAARRLAELSLLALAALAPLWGCNLAIGIGDVVPRSGSASGAGTRDRWFVEHDGRRRWRHEHQRLHHHQRHQLGRGRRRHAGLRVVLHHDH